jgi:acyl-CoA synthetase (AMP-forming)/AMP-acid ligase II
MDVTLGELLLESLAKTPDKVLQVCADDNSILTCEQLRISSIRIAQYLKVIGIKSDDVIGMVLRQSHFATCFINGSILMGANVNPVDASLSDEDIRYIYMQTKPKIIICEHDAINKVEKALKDVDFHFRIYTTSDEPSFYLKAKNFLKPTNEEENFIAPKFNKFVDEKILAILCSSGTTGKPKGVCTPQSGTISKLPLLALLSKGNTKTLCFSPLYWGSGFFPNVTIGFSSGDIRVITAKPFSVENFIQIVEKFKISNVIMPPRQLAALLYSEIFLSSNTDSLQKFIVGGAIVAKILRKKFEKRFPDKDLMITYGMTESAGVMSKPGEYKNDMAVGSLILSNLFIKIVDENGKAVDNGVQGEIHVKSTKKFMVRILIKIILSDTCKF